MPPRTFKSKPTSKDDLPQQKRKPNLKRPKSEMPEPEALLKPTLRPKSTKKIKVEDPVDSNNSEAYSADEFAP